MGSSTCTCNARICNFGKGGEYGLPTKKETITQEHQAGSLTEHLKDIMSNDSSIKLLNMSKRKLAEGKERTESEIALDNLYDRIVGAKQDNNLKIKQYCVGVDYVVDGNTTGGYSCINSTGTCISRQTFRPSPFFRRQLTAPQSSPPILEGYAPINPPVTVKPRQRTCTTTILCVMAAVLVVVFLGYVVYRYIDCIRRRRREKKNKEEPTRDDNTP